MISPSAYPPPYYRESPLETIVGFIRAFGFQNHPDANRRGVIEGLSAPHRFGDREVAETMRRREAERGDH